MNLGYKKTLSKHKSGMTLLEVLLVTGLMSFVAIAIFNSVRTMLRAKEKIDRQSESTQEFRAILGLMTRDLQGAFFNTAYDYIWNPLPKPADQLTEDTPQEDPPPLPITIFYGKSNEVFLASRTHQRLAANTPENEQHFVTYQLQEQKLVRAESPRAVNIYDREDPSKFKSTVLIDRVDALSFRYFDLKTDNWVDSWDTESSTYRDRLPAAVQIDLVISPLVAEGEKPSKEEAKKTTLSTAVSLTNVSLGQGRSP